MVSEPGHVPEPEGASPVNTATFLSGLTDEQHAAVAAAVREQLTSPGVELTAAQVRNNRQIPTGTSYEAHLAMAEKARGQ